MKIVNKLQGWRNKIFLLGAVSAAIIFAVLFVGSIPDTADAATTLPTKMNFQGRLTGTTGNIVANGTYNMRFKIYSAQSSGTQLWSEDRLVSVSQGVTVTNGQFSVQLGSVSALNASVFTSNSTWFEVELPSPASATSSSPSWTEGPMSRNQIATTAYAYNAETLDGIDSAAFAQLGQTNAFTAANSIDVSNANAFQVKSGSTGLFNVATSTNTVTVGTSDTTGALLVLDTKTSSGDPTGVNGGMYYNSNTNVFRCYENNAWKNCIASGGTTTLQDAYNNSTSPATITETGSKGIQIATSAPPTADMFVIDNTGQPVATAGVSGLQINYVGGAGTVEASAARIDLTPGTTSGSNWNGLRIVANSTGAVSGVTESGLNLDGPTSPGAGVEVALNIDANWDAGLQLTGKNAEPPMPSGDNIYVYAQKYAGRSILAQKGASGVAYAYQPALFEQSVALVSPGNGATVNSLNTVPVIDATLTTPAASEALGYNMNLATAATANDTAGLMGNANQAQYFRGSIANGSNGFFSVTRLALPDANYGSGATGARVWTGLTTQAGSTTTTPMTSADAPTGSFVGFRYSTNTNDTNWMLATSNGGTPTHVSTGMAVTVGKVYDFYLYTPPQGTSIFWRIDNLTDGITQEGSTTTTIPATNTGMRYMMGLSTLTTTARNLRVGKIYVEADR